jgi:hypothetical protein
MKRFATIALVLALAGTAHAVPRQPEIHWLNLRDVNAATTLLDGVALNAAAGTRTTAAVKVAGLSQVTVYVDYTHGSGNVTAVTLACTAGPSTTSLAPVDAVDWTITVDGAAATQSQVTITRKVTASGLLRFLVGPLNDEYIKCVVGSTGTPDGTDLVDVTFRGSVL